MRLYQGNASIVADPTRFLHRTLAALEHYRCFSMGRRTISCRGHNNALPLYARQIVGLLLFRPMFSSGKRFLPSYKVFQRWCGLLTRLENPVDLATANQRFVIIPETYS